MEEASLRRQYKDPDAPEVAFVADQVSELQRQIQDYFEDGYTLADYNIRCDSVLTLTLGSE